ncbi:MAG: hypothetical protein HN521_15760 [Candidatus Latescibacteria bacterium]|nr:hypothetical protein [Candidatus Latescibacterota bacterium]MBT5831791.1 hypothetical protein [Candidatus Latescibacterota bacterium]
MEKRRIGESANQRMEVYNDFGWSGGIRLFVYSSILRFVYSLDFSAHHLLIVMAYLRRVSFERLIVVFTPFIG